MKKFLMAPEIASGAYHVKEFNVDAGNVAYHYPKLLEPRNGKKPKIIAQPWGDFYVLHEAERIFKDTVDEGYNSHDFFLYRLGGGGFVSVAVGQDVADVSDYFSRTVKIHATFEDGMSYLAQEIMDASF